MGSDEKYHIMNNGNPFGAMVAFFIFMQVVWSLALLGGGLYVLWCLNRIATSVERLAHSRETETAAPATPLAPPFSAQPFVPTTPSPIMQAHITHSPETAPPAVASPRSPEV